MADFERIRHPPSPPLSKLLVSERGVEPRTPPSQKACSDLTELLGVFAAFRWGGWKFPAQ